MNENDVQQPQMAYGFLDDFWQYTEFSSDEETQALDITNDKELTGTVEYVLTVCSLSDKELQILRKHYQQNITYREIGREYGVTGSRAREIARHPPFSHSDLLRRELPSVSIYSQAARLTLKKSSET